MVQLKSISFILKIENNTHLKNYFCVNSDDVLSEQAIFFTLRVVSSATGCILLIQTDGECAKN